MSSPYVPLVRTARPLWNHTMVVLAVLLALSGLLAARPQSDSPAMAPNLSRLPLAFVANAGQASLETRFVVRGVGTSLNFTPDSVALASPGAMARLVFQGASPTVELQGTDALPGVANYYLGNDPAQWHTGLPTYGAVVYRQLYPGIDLRYEGGAGSLKGTYTITPGANPGLIRWSYQGVTGINLDEATGNLLVTSSATGPQPGPLPGDGLASDPNLPLEAAAPEAATLVESAPIAWQAVDGRRVPVEVRYGLLDGAVPAVGFALGAYDTSVPLTIDPTLAYSTFLGGGSSDEGNSIAVDSQGNAYITGQTYSSDLPGATNSKSTNGDAFVSKVNSAGSAVFYTTYLGGTGLDTGYGVAVDNSGNAYVTGSTDSSDFPLQNAAQPTYGTNTDAFVSKLSASGNLSYSTYIGDANYNGGNAIAVNKSTGDAYVTGTSAGDVLAARLDPSGAFAYAGSFGGFSDDKGLGIALDGSGNAYITGETTSYDFPITANALQYCNRAPNNTTAGCDDAFVSVLNPDGTQLIFSTFLGGSSTDNANGIALDSQSNIYVMGSTVSQDLPTVNPYQAKCAGAPDVCSDAFVAKIKSDFSGLAYSTYMGGATGVALGNGIAVDTAQDAYVVGTTSSPNFPVTTNATQPVFGGGFCMANTRFCYDAFVAEFNPAGNALVYSTYLGGNGDDQGRGIAIDSSGAAYLTGLTESSNFPTVNPLHSYGPPRDAFVTKISPANASTPTATPVGGATPTSTPATPTSTVQPPSSTATPVNTPVGGLARRAYLPLSTKNGSSGW